MKMFDTVISYISETMEIEGTMVLAVLVIILCSYISLRISIRRPLYYYLFLVEMHTWSTRRIVQVLHLGQEYIPTISWNRLVSRMRARAPRVENETRVAVSDTNIVIQSPNTVIDSQVFTSSPDPNRITFWDIEMPPRTEGQRPDASRDSQYAAAAAIAILARGTDRNLRSQVFFDHLRNITTEVPSNRAPSDHLPSVHQRVVSRSSNVTQPSAAREFIPEEHIDEDHVPTDYSNLYPHDDQQPSTSYETNSRAEAGQEDSVENEESEREEDDEQVLIRLKFMDDTERDTLTSLNRTIAQFKRAEFHENEDLNNKPVIRLIYQGQLLRDDRTLKSYGLQPKSVLHCHVSTIPLSRPTTSEEGGESDSPNRPITSATSIYPPPRRRERHELAIASQQRARDAAAAAAVDEQDNEDNETTTVQMLRLINLLLYSIIPIITALGFDIFRLRMNWNRGGRHAMQPSLLWLAYQYIHNFILDEDFVGPVNPRTGLPVRFPTRLFWVFGGQLVAVSTFFFFFPHVVDKSAMALLCLLSLYFVFVVWKSRRAQENQDDENIPLNAPNILRT